MIWKQRNECVFDNARPSIDALVDRIKDKAKSRAKAGAQGLRVVLPASWDVHWTEAIGLCKYNLLGGMYSLSPFQCNETQKSLCVFSKKNKSYGTRSVWSYTPGAKNVYNFHLIQPFPSTSRRSMKITNYTVVFFYPYDIRKTWLTGQVNLVYSSPCDKLSCTYIY